MMTPDKIEAIRARVEEARERDANFIAHAREDIPALLDEIVRLRALLDKAGVCAHGKVNMRWTDVCAECLAAGRFFVEP